MYDAAIVGAGPAGSSLALRLARRGFKVALLERMRFPRTKVCGEYLGPSAVGAIEELGLMAAIEARAHRIRRISLAGFGIAPLEFEVPGRGALGMARAELDDVLFDAAQSAGADAIAGSYMSSTESLDGLEIVYRTAHGHDAIIACRALVGADGAWSAVAHRCGLIGRSFTSAASRSGKWAVGGHLRGQADSDTLEMYAGREGYYARNPIGNGTVNEMLVMPRPTPDEQTDAVALAVSDGRRRFERERLERRVATGPLRYRPSRVARGRVLLTGDAAGLVDPFTGQGVALALMLSEPAADAVAAHLADGDARAITREYTDRHRALVAPRRRLAGLVDAIIRSAFLRRRVLRNMDRRPHMARELIAAVAGAAQPEPALTPRRLLELFA